jgi:hypothetical protein
VNEKEIERIKMMKNSRRLGRKEEVVIKLKNMNWKWGYLSW